MESLKIYVRSLYVFWSFIYDGVLDKLFVVDREKVVKQVEGHHVLELGIGTGLNLPYYSSDVHVVGVDFSSAMLRRAASKKQPISTELHVADASSLPFADSTFDAALATFFFRVTPEPRQALNEASRVVKKNGMLVIADHFKQKFSIWQPFTFLLGWGLDRNLDHLIKETSWKLISNDQLGKSNMTRLVVIKNTK